MGQHQFKLNEEDGDDVDEEEAVLASRCRREGPPGPAGGLLALPGCGPAGTVDVQQSFRGQPLAECLGWLYALRALDLPFDQFHLGAGARRASSSDQSFLGVHNLAAVTMQPLQPRRWHLLVLIRRVEMVAGEIDITVSDHTGEVGATVDRRVPLAWPLAISEGVALLLAGVMAVPPALRPIGGISSVQCRPRLLIMEKSVVRTFSASELGPEEAHQLLVDARAAVLCVGG